MNILFRCDSSITIGLGHLSRCLALSRYMNNKYNVNIFFAMKNYDLQLPKIEDRFTVIKFNDKDSKYILWLESCLNDFNIDILILDVRNDLNRENLKKVKNNNKIKIITIDDPEEKRLECDIAFYPPVHQLKTMNWDSSKAKLYIGFKYFILKKEFTDNSQKKIKNKVPKILISLGGSDPDNHTLIFLKLLLKLKISEVFQITILLGPGFAYHDELQNFIKIKNLVIDIVSNPFKVSKVFKSIDLGIISFGVTAYELAAIGVPALYFCRTKDHELSSRVFVEKHLGKVFAIGNNIENNILEGEINQLMIRKTDNNFKNMRKIKFSDLNKISEIILNNQFIY